LSNDANNSIKEANENSEIAQKLKDEVDGYVEKIEALIKAAEEGNETPEEDWLDLSEVNDL